MVYNGTNINVMKSTFSQNNATNGGAIYFEVSPITPLVAESSTGIQLINDHCMKDLK